MTILVDTTHSPYAALKPVPVAAVHLTGGFWSDRRAQLVETALPAQYQQCEQTGRIDNFRRAAGQPGGFQGFVYNDSDVHKWLEATCWAQAGDTGLDLAQIRELSDRVGEAVLASQQPDGYLDTYFVLAAPQRRWENLRDWHELYCMGHFIQAAIACYRTHGDERMLAAAERSAGLICDVFGPEESGRRPGVPGHEEIEIALVELYRTTGERRYLEQAGYFLEARGRGLIGGLAYHQDRQPFMETSKMEGHAVRALYLNMAATDVYAESGDPALKARLELLWEHMTARQMYVTGGIGSRHAGESIGDDFELSNERAYAETCAAVANVMWNWRLLQLDGQARYADLMELALYNAVLAGISADGQHYFYVNPLGDYGGQRRQPWFECACCPPNIARLLASLPGRFYSLSEDSLWLHLYGENRLETTLPNGQPLRLSQQNDYPWDGRIRIELESGGQFGLNLRIPAWCTAGARLQVNGQPVQVNARPGSYLQLKRSWSAGDVIQLDLAMPVEFLRAHPRLRSNAGRLALRRGPLIYCLETADHPGVDLDELRIDARADPQVEHHPDLLGGITTIGLQARSFARTPAWDSALYLPYEPETASAPGRLVQVMAVPYFAWANRQPGQMQVWLQTLQPDGII